MRREAEKEAGELKLAILKKASEESEKLKKEARAQGYQEGYKAGCEKGRQEQEAVGRERLVSFDAEIEEALKAIDGAKERCMEKYLDQLKECSIAVAEKVIHVSLQSSGEVIRQMIVAATEKLKKSTWVKIYMDRPDYDRMIQVDSDMLDELSHLSDNIKFVVMDQKEEGSCIIERPEEVLDISVSTQLENIKDILANP